MCLPFKHIYKPEIDSKGYQFCTKCGYAHYVGLKKCSHKKLNTIEIIKKNYSLDSASSDSLIYIQECEECGKIFSTRINE